ncbi:hypothetical protein TYRP_019860 [Tyrophagus putrescentiae]|nr:hypothetical protein TYRP_019860 [Tyrophagus putrescentiae]
MSRRPSITETVTPSTSSSPNSSQNANTNSDTATTTDVTNTTSTLTPIQPAAEHTSTSPPSPTPEQPEPEVPEFEFDRLILSSLQLQSILLQSVTEPEAATTAATAAQNDLSDLLQYYQCPFEADPELLCSFYTRFDGMCPFGHRLNAITTTGIEPTELPSYICVLYLLCRCHGDATVGAASGLTRCKDGLHLTTAELMDGRRVQEMLAVEVLDADSKLEQREQEVQQIINRLVEAREEEKSRSRSRENLDPNADDQPDGTVLPPPEEPDCCSICYTEFTTVEAFGLLEKCDHAFCASCILTWFQNRTELRERICPYCRAESNRLVVWPAPKIDSTEQKATVFELHSDDHNNNNYKRNGKNQAMVSTFPESHVLAYFQCPFQDNGQLSCSYLVHFKTSQYRSGCPFGHQVNMTSNADQQQQIQLRELPPYVCFAYLSHGCCNAAVSSGNSGGDISISASTNNSNALPRCSEGFHPSMEDLVDLEQLHQKMAFHILSGDAKAAKQAEESTEAKRLKKEEAEKLSENTLHADDQCCVCLESVSGGGGGSDGSSGDRLFGLTEGCAHVFCSDCLLTWCEGRVAVANRNTHKCPTCRVETGKVLVAQRLPASEAEKAKLFAQQYKCMAISRRAMTPPLISDSDDDDEDEDDDDDDDDDDENFTMNLPAIMRVVARVARVLENAEDDEDEDEGEGEGEGDNVDGEDNNAVNNGDDRHVFNFDNPSLRRVLTLEDIEEDDGEEEEEEEQEQAVHLPVINGTVYIDPSTLLRFNGRPRQLQNRRPVAAGGDAAAIAGGGDGGGGGGERIGEGGDGGAEDGAGSAASSTDATHGSSSQGDEDEDEDEDEDGEEENRFDEMDISPEID